SSWRFVTLASRYFFFWSCAGRCLFRMHVGRTTGWHRLVEPISEGGAARQPARHDIARKCLGLHDGNIWLTRNGNQIIGGAAAHVPCATPMKWQGNLMDSFSIDLKRSSPTTNERTHFNRATQRNDANIIRIPDLEFSGQLRRNLREHFRLQFREMAQETRHPAGGMMLGQPISCHYIGKPRIAGRSKTVLRAGEPIDYRVGVARIKEIAHR